MILKHTSAYLLGTTIDDWKYIDYDDKSTIARLYYKEIGEQNGFQFVLVEPSSRLDDEGPYTEKSECDVIFHGIAYFDGVRHLHMEYYYYPNLNLIQWFIKQLHDLRLQYCTTTI